MGEGNMTDPTKQVAENGQANQTPEDTEEDDNYDTDDYGKMFLLVNIQKYLSFMWVARFAPTIVICEDQVI